MLSCRTSGPIFAIAICGCWPWGDACWRCSFVHPLFWWLRRAIRADQELLADAAAAGDNRHDYAEELVRLIRKNSQPSPMAVSAAMGIWESPSQLTRRISMLLDDTFRVQPTGSRSWKYQAFGLMMLLGAACSLITLQPAQSAADQSKIPNRIELKAESSGGTLTLSGTIDLSSKNDKPDGEKKEKNRDDSTKSGAGTLTLSGTIEMDSKDNKPDGKNKEQSHGSLIATHSLNVDIDPSKEPYYLAGFEIVLQPEDMKELKVTDEQKKQLRAVEAKYSAEDQKFFADRKGQDQKAVEKEFQKKYEADKKSIRKQVEKIFTPGQLTAIKRMVLRERAAVVFVNPEVAKKLDIDQEQQAKLNSIKEEFTESSKKDEKDKNDKMMAVLNDQQRAKIREAALGPLGQDFRNTQYVRVEGQSKPIPVPAIRPYPDFSDAEVQKSLGLSKEQQNQVRDILGGSATVNDRLLKELQKTLPAKDCKSLEYGLWRLFLQRPVDLVRVVYRHRQFRQKTIARRDRKNEGRGRKAPGRNGEKDENRAAKGAGRNTRSNRS